jgi:hypothetical protein
VFNVALTDYIVCLMFLCVSMSKFYSICILFLCFCLIIFSTIAEADLQKLSHALRILSEAEKQLRTSKNQTTWFTVALLQLSSIDYPSTNADNTKSFLRSACNGGWLDYYYFFLSNSFFSYSINGCGW